MPHFLRRAPVHHGLLPRQPFGPTDPEIWIKKGRNPVHPCFVKQKPRERFGETAMSSSLHDLLLYVLYPPKSSFQVVEMTALPADGSAEALSLAFALESSGLVHFVVRQAAEDQNVLVSRDHTIVYRGTREVNGTSSSAPPQHQLPAGAGAAGKGGVEAAGAVVETVENLEPNSTYEVW